MEKLELIQKIRKSKIKVISYVSVVFVVILLCDFYLANSSNPIEESLLTKSPVSIAVFGCIILAIALTFSYLEKILVELHASNKQSL